MRGKKKKGTKKSGNADSETQSQMTYNSEATGNDLEESKTDKQLDQIDAKNMLVSPRNAGGVNLEEKNATSDSKHQRQKSTPVLAADLDNALNDVKKPLQIDTIEETKEDAASVSQQSAKMTPRASKFTITIQKAELTRDTETFGKMDPFVQIEIFGTT